MEESVTEFKVPRNRIGAIIGPKGSVKRAIENKSDCTIDIDSENGNITIVAKDADPIMFIKAGEVVKAIARGFTPEQALKLFEDDYYLEVISIKEFARGSQKETARIRSRLIGTEGKARKIIEESTGCKVVIMGSTVSIIGTYSRLADAKEAIARLMNGAKHGSVYAWLEERKKEREKLQEEEWSVAKAAEMSPEELAKYLESEVRKEEIDLDEEFDKLSKS